MKKLMATFGLAIVLFGWGGTARSDSQLTVVDTVNLNRYLGKWYEIASYPSWFQKGCTGSTAEYSLLSDGKIQVINRCHKDSLDGPLKVSKGKAEVVDITTNAKLKVWFFCCVVWAILRSGCCRFVVGTAEHPQEKSNRRKPQKKA